MRKKRGGRDGIGEADGQKPTIPCRAMHVSLISSEGLDLRAKTYIYPYIHRSPMHNHPSQEQRSEADMSNDEKLVYPLSDRSDR